MGCEDWHLLFTRSCIVRFVFWLECGSVESELVGLGGSGVGEECGGSRKLAEEERSRRKGMEGRPRKEDV